MLVDERLQRHGGDAAATPFDYILLRSIRIASFLQKVNVGSTTSFLPHAQACTQFTSATDNRKVNCRLGHHFVCHTSSNPIDGFREGGVKPLDLQGQIRQLTIKHKALNNKMKCFLINCITLLELLRLGFGRVCLTPLCSVR